MNYIHQPDPPQIIRNIDDLHQIKKRRHKRRHFIRWTVGAIILLADGTHCEIVHLDPFACVPVR